MDEKKAMFEETTGQFVTAADKKQPPVMKITNSISAAFYRDIIEQARDIILVVQLDGIVVDANQAALQAYGYTIEDLRGIHIYELRSPETRLMVNEQIKIARQEGILFRTVHLRRSGECFPVEVSSRHVRLADGEVLVSIVRDISAAVTMETALRESEEKFRLLNEDLTAAYEELMASEEELRQQLDELLTREAAIRRQNIILALLHDTALGLMQRLDSDEVLKMIVSSATKLLGTPDGFINLVDEAKGVFVREVALGKFAHDMDRVTKVTEGLSGQAYITGEIAVMHSYSTWEHRFSHPVFDGLSCVAVVPLKGGDKVIGVLALAFSQLERTLADHEVSLLQRFADIASIALDSARLIAERKKNEIELRKSQASNQALINAMPDPMFIIKRDGTFVDFKANKKQLYLAPDHFLGKKVSEVFSGKTAAKMMQNIELAIETGNIQVFEYQLSLQGKNEYYEARISVSGKDEVLAISRNITSRRNMEERLEHLSLHDALTGLYNRAFFEEEMKRFQQLRDGFAGLLVCDVDGLKFINDTLGHNMGDTILKAVAEILQSSFRPDDLIARIGGDEFAVLLSSHSDKVFKTGCRRIRAKIDRYNAKNPTVPISLSIGFGVSTHNSLDMVALFKEADNNMYREKLHRQKSTRSAIVQALMKALAARDFQTEGHGDRLQDLIEAFAGGVGLPESNIADLRLLAHFHDIGKVGIPDNILFNPGSLTEEEWVVMRQHCEIGYRIANSAPDLAPIADWVLKHQEWWNGKGYPLGLKGEAIPLECRMLAIVDAFDAMTSDRPYRKAMSIDEAVAELDRCAGYQFDPNLVKCFIELLQNHGDDFLDRNK